MILEISIVQRVCGIIVSTLIGSIKVVWHLIAVLLSHQVLLGHWLNCAYQPVPLLSCPPTYPVQFD